MQERAVYIPRKVSSQIFNVVSLLAALLLCGCATQQFPQDYYTARNAGDRIILMIRPGMKMDEIRSIVSTSELKDYVKEGPSPDSIRTEDEILGLYSNYVHYPKELMENVKVGTRFSSYSYWITAHSSVTLFLFFDGFGKLHGWANYRSKLNFERYWHERITSQLRVKTEQRGMTRDQVHALIGLPTGIIDIPKQNSRDQYVDQVWNSYQGIGRAPVSDLVKQLEVYTYPIANGGQRHVFLGYWVVPQLVHRYNWRTKEHMQIPNPGYVGPQNDELSVWGYDHAWEEADRYLRQNGSQRD